MQNLKIFMHSLKKARQNSNCLSNLAQILLRCLLLNFCFFSLFFITDDFPFVNNCLVGGTSTFVVGSVNDNYFGKQVQESLDTERSRGLFNTGLFAIQSMTPFLWLIWWRWQIVVLRSRPQLRRTWPHFHDKYGFTHTLVTVANSSSTQSWAA